MPPDDRASPAPQSAASGGIRACRHQTKASGPMLALRYSSGLTTWHCLRPNTSQSRPEVHRRLLLATKRQLTHRGQLTQQPFHAGMPMRTRALGLLLDCGHGRSTRSESMRQLPFRTSARTSGIGSEATWTAAFDSTSVRYLSAACAAAHDAHREARREVTWTAPQADATPHLLRLAENHHNKLYGR